MADNLGLRHRLSCEVKEHAFPAQVLPGGKVAVEVSRWIPAIVLALETTDSSNTLINRGG